DLRVIGTLDDGSQIDLTAAATGTQYRVVFGDNIISVTRDGRITALASGNAAIEVTNETFTAIVPVVVFGDVEPFIELEVRPERLTLGIGQTGFVQVIARRVDGTEAVVTEQATFRNADSLALIRADGVVIAGERPGGTLVEVSFQNLLAIFELEVTPSMSELVDLRVEPQSLILPVGGRARLQVIGQFSSGIVADLTRADAGTTYFSENPSIVTVTPNGEVIAQRPTNGPLFVFIRNSGFEAVAVVTVSDDIVPVNLRVEPDPIAFEVGETIRLRVIATFSDGSDVDVTNDFDLVLEPNPADVFRRRGPFLAAVAEGEGELFVEYRGLALIVPIRAFVADPVTSLRITPPEIEVGVGNTRQISIEAIRPSGLVTDVTNNPDLFVTVGDARVANYVGSGRVVGQAPGQTALIANFRGISAQARIDVIDADGPFVRIDFVPASDVQVAVGGTRIVNVIGTRASGISEVVSFDEQLTLEASTPGFEAAVFDGGIAIRGVAPAVGTLVARLNGLQVRLTVQVNQTTSLARIELDAPASLQQGTSGLYSVSAIFTDGTVADITRDPSLSLTLQPGDIVSAADGILTPLTPGTAVLAARFQGQQAQTAITVIADNDPIRLILFLPPQLSLPVGGARRVQLVGIRDSGADVDLTDDPNVELSTRGPIELGAPPITVIGTASEIAEVRATFQGLSASLVVNVGDAPTLVDFAVTPPSPIALAVGQTQPLTVIGTFSDMSTRTITSATFISLNPGNATVTNGGVVRAVSPGTAVIGVTFGGIIRSVTVEITSARPSIDGLTPEAIATGAPATIVTVRGANFTPEARVRLNGVETDTRFIDASTLQVLVPADLLANAGTIRVDVISEGQPSNGAAIEVGSPPQIQQVVPNAVVVGRSIIVELQGSGLDNLVFSGADLEITLLGTTDDGAAARLRVSAPA
ncbi:MAG: Ig-like domain-containing protein, partial [Myxococcota bacterium]